MTEELKFEDFMLTTVDNPFNPFVQFDEWFALDLQLGHNTCGLLARLTHTSDGLSDRDQELDVQSAMRDLIRLNPLGVYKLVKNPSAQTHAPEPSEAPV